MERISESQMTMRSEGCSGINRRNRAGLKEDMGFLIAQLEEDIKKKGGQSTSDSCQKVLVQSREEKAE